MQNGVIAGYPVVDIRNAVYDGSFHDVDSSEMAFKIAASIAFKDGTDNAEPVPLEPIRMLKLLHPRTIWRCDGDINRRRGTPQGMEDSPAGKLSEQKCH